MAESMFPNPNSRRETSPPPSDDGVTTPQEFIDAYPSHPNSTATSEEFVHHIPSNASRQLQINISLVNYISGLRHLSASERSNTSGLWLAEIVKIAPFEDSALGIECFLEASYEYMLWEWRHADRTFEDFRDTPFEKEFTDTTGPGVKYKVRAVAIDRLHHDGLAIGKRAFELLVEWKIKPWSKIEEPSWDEIVKALRRVKSKWVHENGLICSGTISPLSVAVGLGYVEDAKIASKCHDGSAVEQWSSTVLR